MNNAARSSYMDLRRRGSCYAARSSRAARGGLEKILQLAAAKTEAAQLTAHMASLAGRRRRGRCVRTDGETETT